MDFLDCETKESTYVTLGQILGLRACEIDARLDAFDSPDVVLPDGEDIGQFLFDFFKPCLRSPVNHEGTCWFHISRTANPDSFKEGIYPLTFHQDVLWSFMYSLVADRISMEKWGRFRRKEVRDHFGNRPAWECKIEHEKGGPHAFFLQDFALNIPRGYHDYFKTPEVVDDICHGFQRTFGFDIREAYWRSTQPVVVKFRSFRTRTWEIGYGLRFLYFLRQDIPISRYDWPCFCGYGTIVPAEDVLKVSSLADIGSRSKQATSNWPNP